VSVQLHLHVRRFFCDNASCSRRIFAERLGESLPAYAQRTSCLAEALCALAFAAGGEGGARLVHAQAMDASPRTLLRLLSSYSLPGMAQPRVLGIDERAWKKGRTYGTILPVDLLPDRDADSVAGWLKLHPGVEIIVRDRSGLFAEGALRGAPQATQVVDRYHLVQNLVEALESFFLYKRAVLKAVHQQQQAEIEQANAEVRALPVMSGRPSSRPAQAASLRRHAHAVELYEKIHA
jgi:transposase